MKSVRVVCGTKNGSTQQVAGSIAATQRNPPVPALTADQPEPSGARLRNSTWSWRAPLRTPAGGTEAPTGSSACTVTSCPQSPSQWVPVGARTTPGCARRPNSTEPYQPLVADADECRTGPRV